MLYLIKYELCGGKYSMSCLKNKAAAYVGTYTTGYSKGIYRITIDKVSGKIDEIGVAAEISNPTYLCINKSNTHLYSVAKIGDDGGVAAFSLNNSNGELHPLNHMVSPGSPPCHVSLDCVGKYLFSANYHRGSADVYSIREDGSIKTLSSKITHEGSGPIKERQEKPHAHYTGLTPDEKYLCVIDLGIDKLMVYRFTDGIISECCSLSFNPGSGPRHMAFHPRGRFVYLLTELSSELIVLEYDSSRGSFSVIQSISTLPEDYSGENLGSAVHISPDGKYVYASNRGDNSITVFSIDISSGRLEFVSRTPCGGSFPRDFAIEPSGRFLYVTNQNSSNIVSFVIDKSTGRITQSGSPVPVPNPVCIKFLNI